MKKSLNKFIKGYMEVLYALSSIFCITTTSLIFRQPCSMFFLSLRITDKRPFVF